LGNFKLQVSSIPTLQRDQVVGSSAKGHHQSQRGYSIHHLPETFQESEL
jgi:hypothetical protein